MTDLKKIQEFFSREINEIETFSKSGEFKKQGILVTDPKISAHSEIMSNIRSIKGVTVVKDSLYPKKVDNNFVYHILNIKIDTHPFDDKNKLTDETLKYIVDEIKKIKGVKTFKFREDKPIPPAPPTPQPTAQP